MKLAVATNDKKKISKDCFKMSDYYLVFEILNGEIVSEELRENPYVNKYNLENLEKTDRIVDLLKDCSIFLGTQMEKQSLDNIASKNIDIIITTKENINETISSFLGSLDKYFKYYDSKSKKFMACKDRMIK